MLALNVHERYKQFGAEPAVINLSLFQIFRFLSRGFN
jgi:hypothetical protein